MKRLFGEIFIILILIFLILHFLKRSVPYSWGNTGFSQKVNFVKKNPNRFDSFFFGSSKTWRHIDSRMINQLSDLHSFNLGYGATFTIETEYLIHHFVKDRSSNIGQKLNLFVQDVNYKEIAKENRHTIRAIYFLDFKRTFRALKYYFNARNYTQLYYYTLGFIENQLCIGQVFDLLKYKEEELSEIQQRQLGFLPLDQFNSEGLNERKREYRANLRDGEIKDVLTSDISLSKIDAATLGIEEGLNFNLYKIDGDPFSPLKDSALYFDRGHYNSLGAQEFTMLLAKSIVENNIVRHLPKQNMDTDNSRDEKMNIQNNFTDSLSLTSLTLNDINGGQYIPSSKVIILKQNLLKGSKNFFRVKSSGDVFNNKSLKITIYGDKDILENIFFKAIGVDKWDKVVKRNNYYEYYKFNMKSTFWKNNYSYLGFTIEGFEKYIGSEIVVDNIELNNSSDGFN